MNIVTCIAFPYYSVMISLHARKTVVHAEETLDNETVPVYRIYTCSTCWYFMNKTNASYTLFFEIRYIYLEDITLQIISSFVLSVFIYLEHKIICDNLILYVNSCFDIDNTFNSRI